jgi:hypothetical protein
LAAYIHMQKIAEDDIIVRYRITIPVTGPPVKTGKSKVRYKCVDVYGEFTFNKQLNQLTMLDELSDPKICANEHAYYRCLKKMVECNRKSLFPPIVEWASLVNGDVSKASCSFLDGNICMRK